VAIETQTLRETLVGQSRPGRRTGAVMVVDAAGRLAGIFTDSDLARLFEARCDAALDRPIREVMTHRPHTVPRCTRCSEAIERMAALRISELPVVDDAGAPLGMLDITDLVGAAQPEAESAAAEAAGRQALGLKRAG